MERFDQQDPVCDTFVSQRSSCKIHPEESLDSDLYAVKFFSVQTLREGTTQDVLKSQKM